MAIKLIADEELIKEDFHVTNVLDTTEQIDQMDVALQNAQNASITAMLGKYGIGKSTALYNLSKRNKQETWVWFDAWKYPDRNNLWEGFVLDFAKQVAPRKFKKVLQLLDGTNRDAAKTLIKTVGTAANLLVPGSGAPIDKLTYFATTSPARRVFQIQDILLGLINENATKPIRIVVEDIDRSQDSGVYFLETLNNFLTSNITKINTDIQVIAPMSLERYQAEEESFAKCVQYVRLFEPQLDLANYVQKLINADALQMLVDNKFTRLNSNEITKQMIVFLNAVASSENLNFRSFKQIIRRWAQVYDIMCANYDVFDWRVLLAATVAKAGKNQNLFKERIGRLKIISTNHHHGKYLAAIIAEDYDYLDQNGGLKFSLNGTMILERREEEGLIPNHKAKSSIEHGPLLSLPEEYFSV